MHAFFKYSGRAIFELRASTIFSLNGKSSSDERPNEAKACSTCLYDSKKALVSSITYVLFKTGRLKSFPLGFTSKLNLI
ncbi:hypothetical protein BpHYR1_022479 [Brachionus plicatilis]|uniref:Uncharacterized protein n=1 Tax=Brachionus plicatilis TaxID=10195 RepID=A0A3M7Q0S5_BRAPC|nr:hypothetical protein BpHYR1_022479 [Brachionus plicatilis]